MNEFSEQLPGVLPHVIVFVQNPPPPPLLCIPVGGNV